MIPVNTDQTNNAAASDAAGSPAMHSEGHLVENPNPRANGNLNDDEIAKNKAPGSQDSEPGAEITDGEDG